MSSGESDAPPGRSVHLDPEGDSKLSPLKQLLLFIVLCLALMDVRFPQRMLLSDYNAKERYDCGLSATELYLTLVGLPCTEKNEFTVKPFIVQLLLNNTNILLHLHRRFLDPSKLISQPATPIRGTPLRRQLDEAPDQGDLAVQKRMFAMRVLKAVGGWVKHWDTFAALTSASTLETFLLVLDRLCAVFNANTLPQTAKKSASAPEKVDARGYAQECRTAAIGYLTDALLNVGSCCGVDPCNGPDPEESEEVLVSFSTGLPKMNMLSGALSFVLKLLVPAFALGGKKTGTSMNALPKDLVRAQLECFSLLETVMEAYPFLLNTELVTVQGSYFTKAKSPLKQKTEVICSDDDDEDEKAPNAKRRGPDLAHTFQDPILAVLTTALVTVPERKEWRERLAETTCSFVVRAEALCSSAPTLRTRLLLFCLGMIRSNKQRDVLLSLELTPFLLTQGHVELVTYISDRRQTGSLFSENQDMANFAACQLVLLQHLLARSLDSQPTIRSRVMEQIGILMLTVASQSLSELFLALTEDEAPTLLDVISMIICRGHDERPIVRKSSLSALDSFWSCVILCDQSSEALYRPFKPLWVSGVCRITSDLRSTLVDLTLDPSQQVRHRALTTVHSMLQKRLDLASLEMWCDCVLPATADVEAAVREKACDLVLSFLVFDMLGQVFVEVESSQTLAPLQGCMADHVFRGDSSIRFVYLRQAFGVWFANQSLDHLPPGYLPALCSTCVLMSASHPQRWSLSPVVVLSEMVVALSRTPQATFKCKRGKAVLKALTLLLEAVLNMVPDAEEPEQQLDIIYNVANKVVQALTFVLGESRLVPEKAAMTLWKQKLSEMEAPLGLIHGLTLLTKTADASPWETGILAACKSEISGSGSASEYPERVCAVLATYASIIFQSGASLNRPVVNAYLALITDAYNAKCPVPPCVRAVAVTSLGMMAVRHEAAARKCVDILAAHSTDKEPELAVRSNCLVVLTDLHVHYTALVDKYVPHMTQCFSPRLAESPLLRKHALSLVAGLVANDYLKCKGPTQHRFLSCLADPNLGVLLLAEAIFRDIVLLKNPSFVQQNLVSSVCHLNGWFTHPNFRSIEFMPNGKAAESTRFFVFAKDSHARQKIYRFVLSLSTDRDRLEVSRKLVHQFLAPFVDTIDESHEEPQLALPKSTKTGEGSALSDVLRILGCRQLKLTFTTRGEMQVDDEEKREYEEGLMKRNLAAQVIPTLISLKRHMEKNQSPFLKDMMTCLAGLLYDYRSSSSLEELLVNDLVLAKQLRHMYAKMPEGKHCEDVELDHPAPLDPCATPNTLLLPPLLTARSRPAAFTPALQHFGNVPIPFTVPRAQLSAIQSADATPENSPPKTRKPRRSSLSESQGASQDTTMLLPTSS